MAVMLVNIKILVNNFRFFNILQVRGSLLFERKSSIKCFTGIVLFGPFSFYLYFLFILNIETTIILYGPLPFVFLCLLDKLYTP